MNLLNRKADYALLILCYLHHRPEGGCARAIASRLGLSRAFVANILKDLCQKGFVSSHRGVKGGYALRHPAEAISLAGLLDALEDTVRLAECNQPKPEECCTLASRCPIRGPIEQANRRIREVLEKITLAEIFGQDSFLDPGASVELELSRCRPEVLETAGKER